MVKFFCDCCGKEVPELQGMSYTVEDENKEVSVVTTSLCKVCLSYINEVIRVSLIKLQEIKNGSAKSGAIN